MKATEQKCTCQNETFSIKTFEHDGKCVASAQCTKCKKYFNISESGIYPELGGTFRDLLPGSGPKTPGPSITDKQFETMRNIRRDYNYDTEWSSSSVTIKGENVELILMRPGKSQSFLIDKSGATL
jgi:hypothetical protein